MYSTVLCPTLKSTSVSQQDSLQNAWTTSSEGGEAGEGGRERCCGHSCEKNPGTSSGYGDQDPDSPRLVSRLQGNKWSIYSLEIESRLSGDEQIPDSAEATDVVRHGTREQRVRRREQIQREQRVRDDVAVEMTQANAELDALVAAGAHTRSVGLDSHHTTPHTVTHKSATNHHKVTKVHCY
jgi:hypothetical protein